VDDGFNMDRYKFRRGWEKAKINVLLAMSHAYPDKPYS